MTHKITRKKPKAKELVKLKLKTISYNEQGNLFLIYKDESGENEQLIQLSPDETYRLIKFIGKLK